MKSALLGSWVFILQIPRPVLGVKTGEEVSSNTSWSEKGDAQSCMGWEICERSEGEEKI